MSELPLKYSTNIVNDVLVMYLEEERIDSSKAPSFKTELLKLIAGNNKRILVCLKNVESIDSSGLGSLTFGHRQIGETGGSLAVCCTRPKVQTLFNIAKLERVLSIYETEEEGIEGLTK